VLEAFQWEKKTADPVLLEAACAFWDALGARAEGESYSVYKGKSHGKQLRLKVGMETWKNN
jgi:hypothetical protein